MKINVSKHRCIATVLAFLLALCCATDCKAARMWPEGSNKLIIEADLGRFPAYTKGSQLTVNFSAHFTQTLDYEFNNLQAVNLYDYISSYNLMLPKDGWKRKINEDLNLISFKVSGSPIDLVGNTVTFYSVFKSGFKPPSYSGKFEINKEMKGSLTLELRRDVVGGAIITPAEIPLIYTYGAIQILGFWPDHYDSSVIFSQIYLKTGGFIPAPAACSISVSGGEYIDFGNIVTDSLTPARENENRKTIGLDYRCNVKKTLPAEVHLLAQRSGFSDAVIASTNPAVGIALAHNSVPLQPNGKFSTRVQDGLGHDTLTAVVTRNPSVAPGALETGPFSASAILVLEQQ